MKTDELFIKGLMQHQNRNNKEEFIEMLLFYFDEEIKNMSKYIKMPREDAIQSIKTDFIEYISENW
ncbi:hypothetical protein LOZ80_29920 [Paenibacillus sp. HWE-109]|uniref:hypothetical protein n=1 Tax=Paenibacillus sp. HWE-109 TaxID=1306526 RepID=UPI001EDE7475|nr:hypothetical protein [Paenibacillus sp. HWE-109]UKS25739.1 hypothetical protein LOZ80_29920 [Paenibacillus sp. HWE-109]